MKNENIITISNFSKSFGPLQVIKNLSFEVKRGEIFAFLGANGSGKTTTIRCLLGIYGKDEGELLIDGKEYDSQQSNLLGYLPEERGLYTTSKVLETMVYFGEIKGLSKNDATKKSKEFLEMVGLSDKENIEINKLSSGQQQKIQLGITIINVPELLILDEPTKGLDPVNRTLLMDILLDLNKKGSTIVFSTHQMDEAERIANRVMMIKDGARALYGNVEEIKEEFGNKYIVVEFSGKLENNPKLFTGVINANYAELTLNENVSNNDILKYLIDSGIKIRKFEQTTPSLNEIFIKVSNSNNNE